MLTSLAASTRTIPDYNSSRYEPQHDAPQAEEYDEEDEKDGRTKPTEHMKIIDSDKKSTWVTRVRIVRDRDTQLGKGFAYVQFVVSAKFDL